MPPPIASTYADTPQGRLHFLDSGSGETLLLLGPAGRNARVFEPLIDGLSPHFRVLAADLPGHGLSHPMPAAPSIEALADELVAALAALGVPRSHVFGLHTGNKLCAAIGARHPGSVARLIVCGQSHSLVPEQERRNAIIAGLTHGPGESECDTRSLYEANFAYDMAADLARIQAPTLVLELASQEEDRTVGRQGEAVRALVPGARQLAVLEHREPGFCTLEHLADETAALLVAFLGSPARP